MPGGDRTGPMGMGSRTGRGRGFCSGFAGPGWANFTRGWFGWGRGNGRGRGRGLGRGRGWGLGRGFGRGYGWRSRVESETAPQDDLGDLKAREAELQSDLKDVQRQIEEFSLAPNQDKKE